jgi:dienelactone hydrolase
MNRIVGGRLLGENAEQGCVHLPVHGLRQAAPGGGRLNMIKFKQYFLYILISRLICYQQSRAAWDSIARRGGRRTATLWSMRLLACLLMLLASPWLKAAPDTVDFASLDGQTQLRGFLYKPAGNGPWPAVVMLHGRAGPYSSAARGRYDATTISQRHRLWGEFWAARGYVALLVDSFGPRGHAAGFPAGTYASRPPEVNEQRVRPLDAYAALAWLRSRGDVIADRIGLQGWSNGAMATLAIMAERPQAFTPPLDKPSPATGFRAALAFYPGCAAQAGTGWRSYAPMIMMVASRDEEVSPVTCRRLADEVRRAMPAHDAGTFEFVWYEGAQHAFDDPGKARQAVEANRLATEDARRRADAFFAGLLKPAAQ